MKKIILILALFYTTTLYAQEGKIVVDTNEKGTRVKIGRSNNVSVQETDGATRIRLGSTEVNIADDNVHIDLWKEQKHDKFRGHWAGIELGLNGYAKQDYQAYTQKDFMDLRTLKSITVRLNLLQFDFGLSKHNNNLGLLTGLGLESKDYRFENNYTIENLNGITQPKPLTHSRLKKSKLNILYLSLPLIFEMQFPNKNNDRRFHLGLGVEGGWRIGSRTKIKYKDGNGWKKRKNRNSFNLNDFKLDAQLRIGYSGFKFFINYGLIDLFEKGKGPELQPITLGLTLISF